MAPKSVLKVPRQRLDLNAIKSVVDVMTVAIALLGEPAREDHRGAWWVCPLHNDRNPSFIVSRDRGWRCFGCGEHGDAVELVKRLEGLSFPDAARRAVELSGGVGTYTPSSYRPKPVEAVAKPCAGPSGLPVDEAVRLVDAAADRLWRPEGAHALGYLRGRGLEDETIRSARLGFVDRVTVPTKDGDRTFRASGVSVPWFDGDRLAMVKIRQGDARPKYVEAFRDAPTIFPSPDAIRPGVPLAIVEGEFDAILLNQLIGDFACVVTLGSASSKVEPDVLGRMTVCPRWYAAHDADDAGERGAAPWLELGWAARVRPPAKDWTDAHGLGFSVVRSHWLGAIREAPRPTWEELEGMRWGDPSEVEDLGGWN